MAHPRISMSIILAVYTIIVSAQSNFEPGYIITNEHDTINGLIDNRGDLRNGRKCTFQKSPGEEQSFLPGEIFAYRFESGKYYVSIKLPFGQEEQIVFGEYLVDGIADLYYFRDVDGDHYYIEKGDIGILELTNKTEHRNIDGKLYYWDSNKYIGMLKATFNDCQGIQKEIESASLSHKSLITVTKSYHDYICDDEVCIVYDKEIPQLRMKIVPLAGLSYSDIYFKTHPVISELQINGSLAPFLGIELNTSAPRINDRISLQISTCLAKDYFYGLNVKQSSNSVSYLDIHINTLFLKTGIGFNYTYPKGQIRPFVSLGGIMNTLLWSERHYTTELVTDRIVIGSENTDIPVPGVLFGGYFGLGLDYYLLKKLVFFTKLGFDIEASISEVDLRLWAIGLTVGVYL